MFALQTMSFCDDTSSIEGVRRPTSQTEEFVDEKEQRRQYQKATNAYERGVVRRRTLIHHPSEDGVHL